MLGKHTILAGLIAILVIGNALGESKRPSHRQQPQAPSAQPTQASTPDQRGTDQIPLTIKVLPSEDAKERAEKEERERAEKAGIDKKLADETQRLADETQAMRRYTGGLAIFTLFLFFAAIGQIALFVWQLRLIRESLNDAKIAANARRLVPRLPGMAPIFPGCRWFPVIGLTSTSMAVAGYLIDGIERVRFSGDFGLFGLIAGIRRRENCTSMLIMRFLNALSKPITNSSPSSMSVYQQ